MNTETKECPVAAKAVAEGNPWIKSPDHGWQRNATNTGKRGRFCAFCGIHESEVDR